MQHDLGQDLLASEEIFHALRGQERRPFPLVILVLGVDLNRG